jgi:hypothetical protein
MMERDDTRHGRSGDTTRGAPWEPYKTLRSVIVTVTVQCVNHGSHTAKMQGPYLRVLDAVALFREVATAQGRWVITEYTPSEEELPQQVSEWT